MRSFIFKIVGITIGVIIIVFASVVGYFMYKDYKQKLATREVIAYQDMTLKCPDDTIFKVLGVKFKMIGIKGGTVKPSGLNEKYTLSNFYLGETEVTQELWVAIMGKNPSHFNDTTSLPVESVSLIDCIDFVNKLDSLSGYQFYIPSLLEWDYAACIGKTPADSLIGKQTLNDIAWHKGNSAQRTHQVKTRKPNKLGIYDMIGNVAEWTYSGSDPLFLVPGGSWNSDSIHCKIHMADCDDASISLKTKGLRLAWNGKKIPKKR